jgi:hypothetical protein
MRLIAQKTALLIALPSHILQYQFLIQAYAYKCAYCWDADYSYPTHCLANAK